MTPGVDTEAAPVSEDPLGPDAVDGQELEPLACVSCRARKLKCDRTKPACTRCVKVSNECVYPESRRKPTVKRRNVKELESRLGTSFPGKIVGEVCLHFISTSGRVPERGNPRWKCWHCRLRARK